MYALQTRPSRTFHERSNLGVQVWSFSTLLRPQTSESPGGANVAAPAAAARWSLRGGAAGTKAGARRQPQTVKVYARFVVGYGIL